MQSRDRKNGSAPDFDIVPLPANPKDTLGHAQHLSGGGGPEEQQDIRRNELDLAHKKWLTD